MTLSEIYEQAQQLNSNERKTLMKMLMDSFETDPHHKLSELRGLGAEIWQDIDTTSYLDELRDEWDKHA